MTGFDRAHGLELLHQMMRIRRLEERSAELYGLGKIRGFLHLYIGEEAVAVGAMQALGPEDAIVATYREHGQALARGIDAGAVMAEMYGKTNGCSRGRGGSMHLFSAPHRFYGGNAIVGGGFPLAVGLALAAKMQGQRSVVACFFGDGATAEGEFHESLNLAALWQLPVLFLCENNVYAMGTALERHQANREIVPKAAAHGLPAEKVDGMDVLEVERAVRYAADSVREQGTPRFLELSTYRFRAHSMFDPEHYRTKAEVAKAQERDPILLLTERLRAEGVTDEEREAIARSVEDEIETAVQMAEDGEWEPVEHLTRDVVTEEVGR
ncbi:MAG: pyruvate dehydrogenase (acetyl-transferring) E1 component subunit alpha [Sandaracinaceae bacterium]|nr:MAG: pyruvate dehydrogenase (acetyl-transferring) E1 component subunit alpha [Sandaracinaceae bacterium]HBQ20013.1 pyruvate dehydrogenase (acetyl-transferring) E1 component subunit alpha [Myxococcales bacterium]